MSKQHNIVLPGHESEYQSGDVLLKEKEPRVYECVLCNQMKEAEKGKKVAVYLKETLGTRSGFMCPNCEATHK